MPSSLDSGGILPAWSGAVGCWLGVRVWGLGCLDAAASNAYPRSPFHPRRARPGPDPHSEGRRLAHPPIASHCRASMALGGPSSFSFGKRRGVMTLTILGRANTAYIRQSRPDSSLGCQEEVLHSLQAVPSSLGSGTLNPTCISQPPHKSVNLSFTITDIKNNLTDLCGN